MSPVAEGVPFETLISYEAFSYKGWGVYNILGLPPLQGPAWGSCIIDGRPEAGGRGPTTRTATTIGLPESSPGPPGPY